MSKHNNNLHTSTDTKCRCGRRITIGEWYGRGQWVPNYECPDCTNRKYSKPITPEEYYNGFNHK